MIVTPGVTDVFRMRADATQAIRNTLVQNVRLYVITACKQPASPRSARSNASILVQCHWSIHLALLKQRQLHSGTLAFAAE